MSIIVDVDVDIDCAVCGTSINSEHEVVCMGCYGKGDEETMDVLRDILPYFNEATILSPVEIPGEVAFKLRERIRRILGEG